MVSYVPEKLNPLRRAFPFCLPDRLRRFGLSLFALATPWLHSLLAQTADLGPTVSAELSSLSAELIQRLAETKALLADVQTATASRAPLPPGITEDDRLARKLLLEDLVRTYGRHLFVLAEIDARNARRDQLQRQVKGWQGFPEGAPYSLLLVDNLREALHCQDQRLQVVRAIKQYTATTADSLRSAIKGHETRLRQLTEALESTADPTARERTQFALELEKLQLQLASANLAGLASEDRLADATATEANERRHFVQSQLRLTGNQIIFSQADLDRVTGEIDQEIQGQQSRFAALNAALSRRQAEWQQANAALTAAQGRNSQLADLPVLQEVVDLRADQLEALRLEVELQRWIIEGHRHGENIYRLRFVLLNRQDLAGVKEASLRLEESSSQLQLVRAYLNALSEWARGQMTEQLTRLRALPMNSPLVPLIQERLASFQERLEAIAQAVDDNERGNRFVVRWSEMVADSQRRLPFLDRLQLALRDARHAIERLWNFELYSAVDTLEIDGQKITGRRSVTVAKVLTAMVILALGYFACRLLAGLAREIASHRFKVQEQTARLLSQWVFGGLLAALGVLSLILVKIPFQAFAFLGGALAIGVGFGTQNLFKNLISGLIILIERPMRLGDIVQIVDTRGEVTHIGVRSSIVRRSDGIEVLVPNSTFLENAVTNLTYSSKSLQSTLCVDVVYGSSIDKVTHLLLQVAGGHGLVLKKPAPTVTLSEFTGKGFAFTLSYWINLGEANAAEVASDLRRMIVHELTEAGIALSNMPAELIAHTHEPLKAESDDPPPEKR